MRAGRYPLAVCLFLAAVAAAPAGEVLPLAVHDGRCSFVLPPGPPDRKYFLVIGSLSTELTPQRVQIRTRASREPPDLPTLQPACDPDWSKRVNEWRLYLERHRPRLAPPPAGTAPPPPERLFRLATNAATLRGRLAGVGRHCQVYVDSDHAESLDDTVGEIVRTFDGETLPLLQRWLGHAADIDGDGRFTILLTPRLPAGLGGYVSFADFDRQGAGSRSDLMVLSAALRPGPALRALLLHEYTHAVVYSGTGTLRAEEDWLNEALAHSVETAQGRGWSNLDYRLAAYCNAPEAFPLVVADHHRAGLYRCPGHRGAAYLFLQHAIDRHGPDLLRRLVQTPLTGIANMEVAAGEPFAELFRGWSVAPLLQTGARHLTMKHSDPGRLVDLFDPPPVMEMPATPRHADLNLTSGQLDLEMPGSAVAYVLLHSAGTAGARVEIAAPSQGGWQASLVRLPGGTPRLTLRAISAAGGVRLEVAAHDAPVTLEAVTWSPRLPRGRSDLRGAAARACLERTQLAPGETASSAVLACPPGDQPVVFRGSGRGQNGLPVSGWCEWEPSRTAAGWPAQ